MGSSYYPCFANNTHHLDYHICEDRMDLEAKSLVYISQEEFSCQHSLVLSHLVYISQEFLDRHKFILFPEEYYIWLLVLAFGYAQIPLKKARAP